MCATNDHVYVLGNICATNDHVYVLGNMCATNDHVHVYVLGNICATNDHVYVLFVLITIFLHSWLITGFVTKVTQWVALVEQELLTLLENLSSPPVFSGVCVARSLVFRVVSCISLFVLLTIVLPILLWFSFWLPCWYHQIPTSIKSSNVTEGHTNIYNEICCWFSRQATLSVRCSVEGLIMAGRKSSFTSHIQFWTSVIPFLI